MYLGRQAIFDRHANVVAYELLYRDGVENRAILSDHGDATCTVLKNALVEFGLDEVALGHDVFVNFAPEILGDEFAELLPHDRCVIEVLESVQPDAETVATFERLKSEGYRLALDDVVFEPHLLPLIRLADIVKIDLSLTKPEDLADHVRQIRDYDVTLLAEKVEDYETRQKCLDLGFDLFQGYFYCRPQVLEGRAVTLDRSHTLHLICRLQDSRLSIQEAATLVRQDPTLSMKVLRFINSSRFVMADRVDSLQHAVSLVGLKKLKTLSTLLSLGSLTDKPRELMKTANIRGLMCEMIGRESCNNDSGSFFVVGMFSLLDAFTDRRLDEILHSLPLSDEVVEGILDHSGILGRVLHDALAWERQDLEQLEFPASDLVRYYRRAVKRTELLMANLSA